MTTVTMIVGANSQTSRVNGLVDFAQRRLEEQQVETEIIQVHQLPSQALLTANVMDDELQQVNDKVLASDGVLVFTPIFKASYSGILKTYLDVLPQKALAQKVVYALGLGGTQHHLLALQYALEPVLRELGAEELLQSTFVTQEQVRYEGQLGYFLEESVKQRMSQKLSEFNRRLQIHQEYANSKEESAWIKIV